MTNSAYSTLRAGYEPHLGRPALILPGGGCVLYAELDRLAAQLAAAMAGLGLVPGDRVAVQVEKSPSALALYLGCLRGGFVYVPVNTAYRAAETGYILADAEPALVVAEPSRLSEIEQMLPKGIPVLALDDEGQGSLLDAALRTDADVPLARLAANAPGIFMYTSGTTGRPKGAMLSHAAIAANAVALARCWQFTHDDVLLHCLPLFHAHGLTVASQCVLLTGASMIWLPRFERAQVLDWLPRATVFMGVPTLYTRLLAGDDFTAEHCRGIRLFTCGSAPLSIDTFDRFEARSGHRIVERYGMTETGINTSNPIAGDRKAGSVGRPIEGTEVRIVDRSGQPVQPGLDGEVQIRGHSLFSGYWRNAAGTSLAIDSDGWFSTGDVGRFDADGYLTLVSRIKDVIISGGYNVYPSEVEAAIERMPGVREAAVIGLPHLEFGEGVVGLVVLDDKVSLDEKQTISTLKSNLAGYKVPKRLIVVETLPRNALGKVLKAELRERYSSLLR